jgi:hypothetical protein
MGESTRRPQAPVSPVVKAAIESTPLTGNDDADATAMTEAIVRATGGRIIEVPPPRQVEIPISAPPGLRFAVPPALTPKRLTDSARDKALNQLTDRRVERRRGAAQVLGGWPPDPLIEASLASSMADDPDAYVRALAALSLAITSIGLDGPIIATASDLLENVVAEDPGSNDPEHRGWPEEAASIGVFAACIVAARRRSPSIVSEVDGLVAQLAEVDGERLVAASLRESLAETAL